MNFSLIATLKDCNLQSLESLDLSKNKLSSAAGSTFAFLEECNGLLTLILANNEIDDDGAEALADNLQHSDCNLELLDLSHNGIGDIGIKSLCVTLQQHDSLKTLKLSSNNIGNDGAKSISDTLKCNINLLSLYVDSNNFYGDGVTSLAQV